MNGIEDCFKNKDITCLRYADDLVFICKPAVNIYGLRLCTNFFLEERGLQIKESKTKLVKATEGFDFLGWNFKVKPNGKFISTPTKDNTKKVKDKIKETMKDCRFTLEQRITKCGALVRGWRNYNKFCDMTGHNLWAQALWTWKFIRKQGRYGRKGTTEVIHKAFPSVSHSVNSHIKVKGDKSVFDNDLTYWAKRHNKNYTGITAFTLEKQNHKCKACGLSFSSGDKVELHHVDGNHDNWKPKNVEALHRFCHQHKPIHGEVRAARNSQKEK